jgi:hypothetical protein
MTTTRQDTQPTPAPGLGAEAERAARQGRLAATWGAALPTILAAQGMTCAGHALLDLPWPVAGLLAIFLEVCLLASALLARARVLAGAAPGLDGTATWVLSALSGAISALHQIQTPDGHTWATTPADLLAAALRLTAPLVAAWMWHRVLCTDRRRTTGRTLTDIRRDRRILALAWAHLTLTRLTRHPHPNPRTLARARRHLDHTHHTVLTHHPLTTTPHLHDLITTYITQVQAFDPPTPDTPTPGTGTPGTGTAGTGTPGTPAPSASTTGTPTPGTPAAGSGTAGRSGQGAIPTGSRSTGPAPTASTTGTPTSGTAGTPIPAAAGAPGTGTAGTGTPGTPAPTASTTGTPTSGTTGTPIPAAAGAPGTGTAGRSGQAAVPTGSRSTGPAPTTAPAPSAGTAGTPAAGTGTAGSAVEEFVWESVSVGRVPSVRAVRGSLRVGQERALRIRQEIAEAIEDPQKVRSGSRPALRAL